MSLDSYTNLKAAIADWLNRSDLTSTIPDLITLAEAEMKRRIRRTTNTSTVYVATAAVTPPTDMAEPVSLRINSGTVYNDVPLKWCTPEMLGQIKAAHQGITGRPTHVAYYDGAFQFAPEPDQSYDATLVYVQQLTPLSGSVASNDILVESPDAYLYGALLQAAPYLEHDERIPVWEKKFNNAIDQMNLVREREEYGGGVKDVRLPVIFG